MSANQTNLTGPSVASAAAPQPMDQPQPRPPPHTQHPKPALSGWAGWLVWVGLLALLLAVFGLYMRPDFLLTLADQLWSCM